MVKTVIGVFGNVREAQTVVCDLIAAGFSRDAVRLIAVANHLVTPGFSREPLCLIAKEMEVHMTSHQPPTEVPATAAIALPAALGKLGVPVHEAEYFARSVRAGELLISVMVEDAMLDRAVSLLEHDRSQDGDRETVEWHRPAVTLENSAALHANLSTVNSAVRGKKERELTRQAERNDVRIYPQVARFPLEAQVNELRGTHAEIGAPPRMVVEVVVRYEGEPSQSWADPKPTSGVEDGQPPAELARVLSDIDLRRLFPEKFSSLKGKPLV
ncbi:MAG: hypothetical protein ACREXR_03455 [Gammaproteobacteria bacterium]